ncbi:MAG TPA: hypothetical protein VMN81_09645 [Vicinamibacterales bacterium]|nr:hypothetical protein [Vicinamibacterales bacterium]
MKRAAIAVLALVAGLAAPLRQACGTECAGVTAPSAAAASAEAPCHNPVPVPEQPEAEHCTHDHSTSLRPAPRLAVDVCGQPAVLPAPSLGEPVLVASSASRPVTGLAPGSPPVLIVPLRI